MSWGAVAGVAGGLVGGILGDRGQRRAADATAQAQQAAIDEQRRQYDQTREDMLPWMQAGQGGLRQLNRLAGGDFSGFHESPEYAFTRDQGLQALERGAAARGGMYSGGADADRMRFASGLASQEYGNHWNRLAGLAGVGQSTAGSLGTMGQNMASNIGNAYGNIGNARASAYEGRAQNWANVGYGLAGAFNNWNQNRLAGRG